MRGRVIDDPRPRLDARTGYKYVIVGGKRVSEHRAVMSKKLKRPLSSDEHVHHINGDRGDNRASNLELWTKNHPYGVREEDLVRYAHKILAKHDFEWYVRACQLHPRTLPPRASKRAGEKHSSDLFRAFAQSRARVPNV